MSHLIRALVLLGSVAAVGCGSNSPPTQPPGPEPKTQVITTKEGKQQTVTSDGP